MSHKSLVRQRQYLQYFLGRGWFVSRPKGRFAKGIGPTRVKLEHVEKDPQENLS